MQILPLVVIALLQVVAPEPVKVGPDSILSFGFDFNGLKEDGSPGAVVAAVEFEYAPVGGATPLLVKLDYIPVIGTNTVNMQLALSGIPSGIYNMRARWYDQASQPSIFSEPPFVIENILVPPAAPLNVGVSGN
jgi:hypothetical protein